MSTTDEPSTGEMRTAFAGSPDSYDGFMGRHSAALAPLLADVAGVAEGQRVLDVGCGTGLLTRVLADRVGAGRVTAIEPAPRFAAACRTRVPGADVRVGAAEDLPWAADEFDASLANLVIGFMGDAGRGVAEMRRVTRPGGVVAVSMWDLTGGMTMLRLFWAAATQVDPQVVGERGLAGTAEGDLAERLHTAGLAEVRDGDLTVQVPYGGFDEFWEPFTFGVGPAGAHLASLDPDRQAAVREACRELVEDGPFTLSARAWYAVGRTP